MWIGICGFLRKLALHKLWPFQNGIFNIIEIGKIEKIEEKAKFLSYSTTVDHFHKVTTCDDS